MDDPVGALIGTILLGLGTLILYGAIRNKKVFGDKGILPQALTTGGLADITKIPAAFPSFSLEETSTATIGDEPTKATWVLPVNVQNAITAIIATDPGTGNRISQEMNKIDSHSTLGDMLTLRNNLAVATVLGKRAEVVVIQKYVKELTGVSI